MLLICKVFVHRTHNAALRIMPIKALKSWLQNGIVLWPLKHILLRKEQKVQNYCNYSFTTRRILIVAKYGKVSHWGGKNLFCIEEKRQNTGNSSLMYVKNTEVKVMLVIHAFGCLDDGQTDSLGKLNAVPTGMKNFSFSAVQKVLSCKINMLINLRTLHVQKVN